MRIDTLEVFRLCIPWKTLRRTGGSVGNEPDTVGLDTVLVRLESGGVSGWGEAAPGNSPVTTAEWSGGVFACIAEQLGPMLIGRTFNDGAALAEAMAPVRGNAYARAAIDLAWWDCHARRKNVPLPTLLGTVRDTVRLGAVLDQVPDPDFQRAVELHTQNLEAAVGAGYSRIGLKIRPGWDVQMLSFVRREFGSLLLHADLEGALTLGYSQILYRFDDFFLRMLEQPLSPPDFVSSAMLQENIRTKICLDESIGSKEDAEMAIDLRAGRCFNLKPGRVGGMTTALDILAVAEPQGVDCWVGGLTQTAIGSRFGLALAAKTVWDYPTDDFNGETLLETDIAPGIDRFRDETATDAPLCAKLWTEPGIGIEPSLDIIRRYTTAHVAIGEKG